MSLAKEYGVTRHTIANIMHVLKSTKRIPFGTLGSTDPSSREDPSSQRKDTKAPFVPSGVQPESTASTISETNVLSKVPEGGSEVPSEKGDGEKLPLEGSKVSEKGAGVQSASTASTVSTVLSPEELETFRTLVKNYPETMRQIAKEGAKEYVQSIGGHAVTNLKDVEMQANLKIEEGSAIARMVYLMPKTTRPSR